VRSVLVLQHPQEQDRTLGTVPLLEREIGAVRRVGLSWANLAAAWGAPPEGRWAVLWPLQLPADLPEGPALHLDRGGHVTDAPLAGLVALDGSWSQAKALWWRNPWLLKLDRIVLRPVEPSIYGRLRREPRKTFVSTLEAVADALVVMGEPPEVRAGLRRAMRTMVQQVRDAGAADG
jgi:DTW domain-containing protein YfiP